MTTDASTEFANAFRAMTFPSPANDNWPMCSDWMTPAEALQILRRMKARLQKQLEEDFTRRHNAEFRQDWEVLVGAEKCTLWHYYGVRG